MKNRKINKLIVKNSKGQSQSFDSFDQFFSYFNELAKMSPNLSFRDFNFFKAEISEYTPGFVQSSFKGYVRKFKDCLTK